MEHDRKARPKEVKRGTILKRVPTPDEIAELKKAVGMNLDDAGRTEALGGTTRRCSRFSAT